MARDPTWRWPWRRRDELVAEIRDELDAHLALHVAELEERGLDHQAAVDEAHRRFGDRRRFEKELVAMGRRREARARRIELFSELAQDARLAVRQLRRQRAFALGVILVIALGVGATSAVFAVVDGGLFRPLPFPDGDRLVFLWDDQGENEPIAPSLPEFRDWRDAELLDAAVALHTDGVRWRSGDGWDVMLAGRVEGDLRGVVGREPLLGRWFSPDEVRAGARVAVLDEGTWRTRFGADPGAVGATLQLAEGSYAIVGVAPSSLGLLRGDGTSGRVGVWLPLEEKDWMERGLHFLRVVGRLGPEVDLDTARAGAAVLAQRLRDAGHTRHGVMLMPARQVLVGNARPILLALAGAALFVLLTVCANLGNLFLWKSLARNREMAVRAALGASRARLVRQVLTESIVVSLIGGLAGLLVAHLLIDVTRGVAARAGALAPGSIDLRIVVFAVLISILVGTLFGLWPALRASRVDLAAPLKADATTLATAGAAPWRRKALVAAEVALSVMLLAGTGLLVRSLARMLGEDPGFRAADVISFRLMLGDAKYEDESRIAQLLDELRRRVEAIPGVSIATASSQLPLEGGDTSGSFEVVGRTYTDDDRPGAKKRVVGPGYFEALGIPVLRGRGFTGEDRAGARDVVIISDAVARRHFPDQDPIGKRLRFSWGPGEEQEIVGVVGDVRHDGLDRPATGILYRPAAQFPHRGVKFLVRAGGDPAQVVAAVRREVAALDSTVPVHDVRSLEQMVASSIAPRRHLIYVLGGFALIAALLAAIGAYAVTAQTVSLRTREIGLRVACGARPSDILRMVASEGAVMIGAGAALGLLGALGANRLLSTMLYGVSPHDPVALGAAGLLLGLMAALAIYLPARRAARLDPMVALRAS
jgi:predicted permease